MKDSSSYATPGAFRRALSDKLKTIAAEGKWTWEQLHRQIAYDRLLERLYLIDDGWLVKGAVALLARDLSLRATKDLDLYGETPLEVAEAQLRDAASRDIGDWFQFELGPAVDLGDDRLRIAVTAIVGSSPWVQFHVDLVGQSVAMTGEPDDVPALARVGMPDVEQHGYRVYPLVDHIADKVAAMYERHGSGENLSTRYKDLVDLVCIIRGASVDAVEQAMALNTQEQRRGLKLPKTFGVPDQEMWQRGYAAEASRSLLPDLATLEEALEFVRPFIDPLLSGSARGTWSPTQHAWT